MRSFVVRFTPLLSCSLQAQIGSNVRVLFTSGRRTSCFLVPPLSSNKVPNGTKNIQSSKILDRDWFLVYCFLHQLRASFFNACYGIIYGSAFPVSDTWFFCAFYWISICHTVQVPMPLVPMSWLLSNANSQIRTSFNNCLFLTRVLCLIVSLKDVPDQEWLTWSHQDNSNTTPRVRILLHPAKRKWYGKYLGSLTLICLLFLLFCDGA